MSLFGSIMGDIEDDPFFGSHMRHMRQMNNMMSSFLSDPFGMNMMGGPLALMGPRHNAMMPFMPQMPSLNRLFTADLDGHMSAGSSFSSSTVVMSSGPNGKPQVYSSTSSTKIGPNGIKETRKTLQDSRTGTKKMSIGHHIGERAHVVSREQNLYSGEAEEEQEFINLDEDEAEDFDREFQVKAGGYSSRGAIQGARSPPLRAIAPPPAHTAHTAHTAHPAPTAPAHPAAAAAAASPAATASAANVNSAARHARPSARRPLRAAASPLATSSASVRSVYGASHPQRHRHRAHKHRHDAH